MRSEKGDTSRQKQKAAKAAGWIPSAHSASAMPQDSSRATADSGEYDRSNLTISWASVSPGKLWSRSVTAFSTEDIGQGSEGPEEVEVQEGVDGLV